ncbi:hemin-degrading factor [Flavobacterium agricola]|uniref:Hemin-degrading factor n=1 Tax=Flavobacterium agricola TaxID=2870839 RepID=A0ABY6LXI5_9FLAO|nr:ChuX/HutX family heme-like substrate-binding protein [Flavobacterium agricola]UYW01042.1 hemin-degrading factor [Flavobacterium agricola]
MNTTAVSLKQKWEELKQQQPHLRIRNAAQTLNVSEAELLILNLNQGVTQLITDFKAILLDVEKLGKVMALTRNNECVHERKGVYLNPDFSSPHAQLFVGEAIDLRIFLNHWKFAFAVAEPMGETLRKSLQFFGKDGEAVHKIYLTSQSNEVAFAELVEKYKQQKPVTELDLDKSITKITEKPDTEIDIEGFKTEWKNLTDTHNFFGLLRKYGVSRTQALRLAPDACYAKKIKKENIVYLLGKAQSQQIPIMVFTGNKGIIQIHTGEIHKTMWHNNWYNILDPDFNLHLDMDRVAETWVVRKPTEDGIVTSVEVFNTEGEIIVQFFGKRKPGIPELKSWRNLMTEI